MTETFLEKIKKFLEENAGEMKNQLVMVVVEATPQGEPIGSTAYLSGSTYSSLGMIDQAFGKLEEVKDEIYSTIKKQTVGNKEVFNKGKHVSEPIGELDDFFKKLPLHLLPKEIQEEIESFNSKIVQALKTGNIDQYEKLKNELFEYLDNRKNKSDNKFDDLKDNF